LNKIHSAKQLLELVNRQQEIIALCRPKSRSQSGVGKVPATTCDAHEILRESHFGLVGKPIPDPQEKAKKSAEARCRRAL